MDNASNFGNKNRDNLGHLEKLKLKLLYQALILMVDWQKNSESSFTMQLWLNLDY